MPAIERIGVSLEKDLLKEFDRLIEYRGYQSRSEAIRDLVRAELSEEELTDPLAEAAATICLVYDHHNTGLAGKLIGLQHSHLLKTISSMHIHLSHHDCLEIIVLRGPVGEIRRVGENLIALKGVALGRMNLLSIESEHKHGRHLH